MYLRKQSLGPSLVFWPACHCAPPAACLAAFPKCSRLSTTSCPSKRAFSHLLGNFWYLRTQVLSVFCTVSTHLPRWCVSWDSSHSAAHPIAQEVSPDSVSFANVFQSTPPRFSAHPAPTGGRSPQALGTWSHIVVCLSRPLLLVSPDSLLSSMPCISGSPSATSTYSSDPTLHCLVPRHSIIHSKLSQVLTFTAAASNARDSSSRSVSITSVSSASPRNVQSSQTRGVMITSSLASCDFPRVFDRSHRKYTTSEMEDAPVCAADAPPVAGTTGVPRALAAAASVDTSSVSPSVSRSSSRSPRFSCSSGRGSGIGNSGRLDELAASGDWESLALLDSFPLRPLSTLPNSPLVLILPCSQYVLCRRCNVIV